MNEITRLFTEAVTNKKVQGYRVIYQHTDGSIRVTEPYTDATLEYIKADYTAAGYTILRTITDEQYQKILNKRSQT
jgi:hypothetical protein